MPFLHNHTQKSIIGKFHFGCSFLLIPHLNFISLTTKNELNLDIENDKMLESHKKRLS